MNYELLCQNYPEEYLMHYGVKGMKWGHRKKIEDSVGTFKASNGVKVAPAKNGYVRAMRNIVANRSVGKLNEAVYRSSNKFMDTSTNRLAKEKGVQRMRKEGQALREYNAHIKDVRKGTGTKYLDKAVRKNKIDDAYEKVNTATTKLEKFVYNDATRKKAAKYVVDNKMSVNDARKKARSDANRNTVAFIAAYGALTAASLYAQSKR